MGNRRRGKPRKAGSGDAVRTDGADSGRGNAEAAPGAACEVHGPQRRVRSRRARGGGPMELVFDVAAAVTKWWPIIGLAMAIMVAAIVLPRMQAQRTLVGRLHRSAQRADVAEVRRVLAAGDVAAAVAQPYRSDAQDRSPLWTAMRQVVKARRRMRGTDRIEHLPFPTPTLLGAKQELAIVRMLVEAGFDKPPVLRDQVRTAAEQAVVDRLLPVAEYVLPRHFERAAAGGSTGYVDDYGVPVEGVRRWGVDLDEGSGATDGADTDDTSTRAPPGSAEHLAFLALEGTFHYSVFGAREALVHGARTSLLTREEADYVQQECGVEATAPTREQVLCAQQPVVASLLHLAAEGASEPGKLDLSVTDGFGQTLLHVAAKYGDAEAVEWLLHEGSNAAVDAGAASVYGQTALHMATAGRWAKVVGLLLDAGASVDSTDQFGRTPADYAAALGFTELGPLLGTPPTTLCCAQPSPSDSPDGAADAADAPPSSWLERSTAAGWRGIPDDPDMQALAETPTTIVEVAVEDLTATTFVQDVLAPGRPVVVRGAAAGWSVSEKWSKDELVARFGSVETPASFIPHGYEFGVPAVLTNASAFVRDIMGEAGAHQASAEEPPLFLYSRHGSKFGAVDGDVELVPPFMAEAGVMQPEASFALGPAYSGTPMRFQSSVWHANIYGLTVWWMLPPAHAFYSRDPPSRWRTRYFKSLGDDDDLARPFTCLQRPGDIVYVPEGWSHAFLNLADSVALPVEFDSDAYPHY